MDMKINAEFLFAVELGVCALCIGLFLLIPRLTRKSYLFGVKIPPEEAGCAPALELRKRYMTSCSLGGGALLLACVLQFALLPDITLAVVCYLPLLCLAVYFAAFIPNWKRAVLLKEARGWAVSNALFADTQSGHARGDLSELPYAWYLSSAALILALFIVSIIHYPLLPDTLPIHFGINMEPDKWAEKSWLTLLQMPLISAGFLLIMFLTAVGIVKARLQLDPDNPSLSFAQHRVYRRRMGHALGFMTLVISLVLAIACALTVFHTAAESAPWVRDLLFWFIVLSVSCAVTAIIAVAVKTGQGGCKVRIDAADLNTVASNEAVSSRAKTAGRGDDRYWRLGMFYYNPDDPGVLVEDRFGFNLGFNYARLPVKICAAVFLVGVIVHYVWLTATIL